MIWKRLKKASAEDEENFGRMMEEEKVGCKGAFAMVLSAFFIIILPCIAVLLGFSSLMFWLLGAFGG